VGRGEKVGSAGRNPRRRDEPGIFDMVWSGDVLLYTAYEGGGYRIKCYLVSTGETYDLYTEGNNIDLSVDRKGNLLVWSCDGAVKMGRHVEKNGVPALMDVKTVVKAERLCEIIVSQFYFPNYVAFSIQTDATGKVAKFDSVGLPVFRFECPRTIETFSLK